MVSMTTNTSGWFRRIDLIESMRRRSRRLHAVCFIGVYDLSSAVLGGSSALLAEIILAGCRICCWNSQVDYLMTLRVWAWPRQTICTRLMFEPEMGEPMHCPVKHGLTSLGVSGTKLPEGGACKGGLFRGLNNIRAGLYLCI